MNAGGEDLLNGLCAAEAHRRLDAEGFNELPSGERRSPWAIAAGVLREPMFAMLVAAAALYGVIGEIGEACCCSRFATLSVLDRVHPAGPQRARARGAARSHQSARAGDPRRPAARAFPGARWCAATSSCIAEGDRVPADGVLIAGDHLQVDESLLTGESLAGAQAGHARDTRRARRTRRRRHARRCLRGTLVVRGTGRLVVLATGARSAIGAIGSSLAGLDARATAAAARDAPRSC